MPRRATHLYAIALMIAGVVAVFWKLVLTNQYTFLESTDLANQVMPWLQAEVYAIRHGSVLLWTPYEWAGHSMIGQVQPATVSPFTFLLALAPPAAGHIQIYWIHVWFVFIHVVAAFFAYLFLADRGCIPAAAAVGGLFYATAGYCGNTAWPQQLAPGIWAPLVFLFLLRSLEGRQPLKSAAWAGVTLGASWLCGHHEPSYLLTLTVLAVSLYAIVTAEQRKPMLLRAAIVIGIMTLVSAVQVLPAIEYGRLAFRWTESGATAWSDKVGFAEHEHTSLPLAALLYALTPGGGGLRTDPFAGVVGLSLAAIAIGGAFSRREVRLFTVLGIGALLYALAGNNVLYGLLYALVPGVEKSRSPIVALSIFHFAVAVLAGFGANLLAGRSEAARENKVLAVVTACGVLLLGGNLLASWLNPPQIHLDPRTAMTGIVALLLAGVYRALARGYLRFPSTLALIGLLLIVEQGNEAGASFQNTVDPKKTPLLTALKDSEEIADFLRPQRDPKRIEVDDSQPDLGFTFGDWHRIDTIHAFGVSIPVATMRAGWWQERMRRLLGVTFWVSRQPSGSWKLPVFHSRNGVTVFANFDVMPRAWTVHQILGAPDEDKGAELVRDGDYDFAKAALLVGPQPQLEQCSDPDQVQSITERPSVTTVKVNMSCTGMLVVGDNWYPGWTAQIDGQSAKLWNPNSILRGVVVGKGTHTVTMRYRPLSVYLGLFLTLTGLGAAVLIRRR